MSLSLYEAALAQTGPEIWLRHADGRLDALDVERWCSVPDDADTALLRRLTGPVLDVGCGPGRLGAALAARGVTALGIDVSRTAVQLARARGGAALHCDVFGPVPDRGLWHDVLLIDGNIGIGGSPGRLLSRAAELLEPGGAVHVEVAPPGFASRDGNVRLEQDPPLSGTTGSWFPWSWLSVDDVAAVAQPRGFAVVERWQRRGRWFVELRVRQA